MARKIYNMGGEILSPIGVDALTQNSWVGKKICFLGDSITYGVGTTKTYREMLAEQIGFEQVSYAVSGNKWDGIVNQARTAVADGKSYDAFVIFCGINDFTNGCDLGEWYDTSGNTRTFGKNGVRGYINNTIQILREASPESRIILMTPLHINNELNANSRGLFLNSYVEAIKEAEDVWSVTVIDLYGESGLFPYFQGQRKYYNEDACVHLNISGHTILTRCIIPHFFSTPCPL